MSEGVFMSAADMSYIQSVMRDLDKTHMNNSHRPRTNGSNVIFDMKVVVRHKDGGTLGEIGYVHQKGFVFFPKAAEFEGYVPATEPVKE